MNREQAFEHFKTGFLNGRLAHAYLVTGSLSSMGIPFVEQALQLLACREPAPPCGLCHHCQQVAERIYPDFLWLEPAKKSRVFSVEQIRPMLREIMQTTYASSWKACTLVGADRMNASAANAFLKTLEEPPEHTLFFLLTDSPQALLPTIISRCQTLALTGEREASEPWEADIRDLLAARATRVAGEGKAGVVENILDAERMVALLKARRDAAEDDVKESLSEEALNLEKETVAGRIGARYKKDLQRVIRLLMEWYRDLLLLVSNIDDSAVINRESLDVLKSAAAHMSHRQALQNIRVIESVDLELSRNLPEIQVFTVAFSKLTG